MRFRHGAMLALASWILVLPPVRERGGRDIRAPLSEWGVVWRTFKSEKECDAFLADTTKERGWFTSYGGMCVTENDPRFAQARDAARREGYKAKSN
jgi:hypothetical protein